MTDAFGGQAHDSQTRDFDVAHVRDGTTAQIIVSGEIDMASGQRLRDAVDELQHDRAIELVVLDFERVTFMDSTGLYIALDAHQRLGGRLRVVLSPPIARLLELTGLGGRLQLIAGQSDLTGWVEGVTDHEIDNAIVAMLSVRRAEYRTGHTMHPGITASDIATSTGQPLERVELRLAELESAGRVAGPTDASEEWTRTGTSSHRP